MNQSFESIDSVVASQLEIRFVYRIVTHTTFYSEDVKLDLTPRILVVIIWNKLGHVRGWCWC